MDSLSLQALSKEEHQGMIPSRDKMLESVANNKGEKYQGHPQGKRPDALLRLLLWRVAQLITDEAVWNNAGSR